MVEGLKSLNRKLTRTIPDAVRKQLRSALAVSADQVVAAAESLAPELSGALVNSIGWVWGPNAPSGSISIGTVSSTSDPDLTITIFAGDEEAYYARWQEFGTVNMSANPFFFPAFRLKRRGVRTRINRAVRSGLRAGSK